MHIRDERRADIPRIRAVNCAAFDSPGEADLVDALRALAAPIVSLVADDGGPIVGHILFSPVTLFPHRDLIMMGLAPMAVMPDMQRRGVGSELVRSGLSRCRQLGVEAVVVLGHSDFYRRFGFVPASIYVIRSEYDVPDDVFMAQELRAGSLRNRAGTVRYHAAFARL